MVMFGLRALIARQTARVKPHFSRLGPKPAPQPMPSTFSPLHSPSVTKFNQQPIPPYSAGGRMPEQAPLSNLSPNFVQRTPGTTSLYSAGPNGNSSRSSLLEKGGGTYNSNSWMLY